MPAPLPLQGMGVVVTRPSHQAATLCHLIEAQGATALRFPTLEILPPRDLQKAVALIDQLDTFDMAVFISANAVNRGLDLLQNRPWPPRLTRVAIGKATARTLERRGLPAQLVPAHFSSEALLAMPQMQTVEHLRAIIFRGEGGRDLLGDTLRQRGVGVSYAEVYRRVRPATPPSELLQGWMQGKIQAVIVTSSEGLQNLFAMVGEVGQEWLFNTPLIVVSASTRQLAQDLGFRQPPVLAAEASDEAIVQALFKIAPRPTQATCGDPL